MKTIDLAQAANFLKMNAEELRKKAKRGRTHSYERFVGAYGVVGFSGVKDARKSVFACRRYASADSATPGPWLAGREPARSCTNTGQNLCKYWTFPRQLPGGR